MLSDELYCISFVTRVEEAVRLSIFLIHQDKKHFVFVFKDKGSSRGHLQLPSIFVCQDFNQHSKVVPMLLGRNIRVKQHKLSSPVPSALSTKEEIETRSSL
jgi:hypothetical protein